MLSNCPHASQEAPAVRVELCVLGVVDKVLCTCLQRQRGGPSCARWAVPGGALRIDHDADLLSAVQRVSRELFGIDLQGVRQLGAAGSADRNPSVCWELSVFYRALLPVEIIHSTPIDPEFERCWMRIDDSFEADPIVLDHLHWIALAVRETRQEIEALRFPSGLLPERFTLGELQSICEEVLGRAIDKSSFRRRLNERQMVEPVAGSLVAGMAYRPAQIYKLR